MTNEERGARDALILSLLVLMVFLAGCLFTRTIYVSDGTAVQVRKTIKNWPVWVRDKDGKKVAAMPVKKDQEIRTLCLRCHNRAIQARPKQVIKTVVMPEHLESQKVKVTHICNQCHNVHAPLKYINRAKEIVGMQEKT